MVLRRTVVCCNTKNTVRLRGRLACSPVQICAVVRPGRYSVDAMSADADSLYGIYYECRSVCARGRGLSCAVCVRGVPAGEKRARARRGAGERARVRYARVSAVFGARDTPMTNGGGGVYGAQKGGKNATRGGGGGVADSDDDVYDARRQVETSRYSEDALHDETRRTALSEAVAENAVTAVYTAC